LLAYSATQALQEGFKRLVTLKLIESDAQGARCETDAGELSASFYAPDVVRLRLERQTLPDYGILATPPQVVSTSLLEQGEGITLQAGQIALELLKSPLRLRLRRGEQTLVESTTDRAIQGDLRLSPIAEGEGEWLICLALTSDEAIYGLGEKYSALNHRGALITSWNLDALGVNAEVSYKNTPFAWSSAGWGLFVNTPARVTHGVGYPPWSHRAYVLKVHEPNLDLFLIAAETPAEMLEKYTALTGRTPLPPRWSYGMWMSRAFYKTADELLEAAAKLRERRIPCDVITLDGRAWHKPETRFDFSWDPERYPDPPAFVQQLREMNFRLCLWEYPYLSTRNPRFAELDAQKLFLHTPDGQTYINRWLPPPMDTLIPHLQPSGIVDFTNPEAYAWFRDAHKPLFEMGVAVMKSDYGEAVPEEVIGYNGDSGKRLHNVYALLYNRCVFEAAQTYGKGEALVWGRAGWAGSQRYPVQWGGDPQGDWEGLAGSIRGGLSWGMSGAPFYTHDIGGLYGRQAGSSVLGGGKPDVELYVRWMQTAVMTTHTRFHGTSPREPWEYGERAEEIVRQWLNWRYQLIPYLQGCALEASQTGMPVMRAMALAFPDDRPAWAFDQQYMLGGSLLVVPVVQPGEKVRFYLPAGKWYDIWNNTWVEGPGSFERTVPLEHIPVFGREGTILPLGPAVQHTGELKEGLDLEQVWVFGKPQTGMQLPGLTLNISPAGEIVNLPADVKVRNI
jgi:alpha-D-xyloside xylohydrolase